MLERLRPRPTARLAAALVAGAAALLLAPGWPALVPAVLVFDLALAVLFLAEARRLRSRVSLCAERVAPARLSVGVWNEVALELRSLAPVALRLTLADAHPPDFDLRPGLERLRLAPYGRGRTVYEVRPHRRGRYRFGDLRLSVEGWLGLAALAGPVALGREVKVYPDLASLRRVALGARFKDLVALGFRTVRREGAGDEFEKLRPYLPDDDYRDINWKATAKTSRPVTQVYQTERSQRVLMAIDCGRSMAAPAGDLTKLDLAVNAALVLAHVALRVGDLVGLAVFASGVQALVPPRCGTRHFARIVEVLHEVEEELSFVDFKALTREVASRRLRRGLVVIFTDLLDEASSRPLVEAVRILGRKHAVLVVAPSDPVVLATARRPAVEVEDVYRALAAREALAERRTVIESVRRLGIEVVESSAAQMVVAGVNRYLDMKRRRAI